MYMSLHGEYHNTVSSVHMELYDSSKQRSARNAKSVHELSNHNDFNAQVNSEDFLNYLSSSSISGIHSMKTFYFSTFYTTIPYSKLKEHLKSLIFRSTANQNTAYFVKENIDSKRKCTEHKLFRCLTF